jgi:hypothetical protein
MPWQETSFMDQRRQFIGLYQRGLLPVTELAESFHRRAGIRLPNLRLHAIFHMIVENQLAMAEAAVVATLARLEEEGLSRHDAIHAIGSVLAEHVYDLLKEEPGPPSGGPNVAYAERLSGLTAKGWLDLG